MPMPSRNLGNLGAAAHHCDCLGQAADTAADNQASIDRCHRHDPYPLCSALKQLSRRIAERGERGRESGQSMASWKKRLTVAIRKYCHRDNVAFAIIGNKFAGDVAGNAAGDGAIAPSTSRMAASARRSTIAIPESISRATAVSKARRAAGAAPRHNRAANVRA